MHFQTDSAMPAASPIAAARGRVSLAGVVRLAALGSYAATSVVMVTRNSGLILSPAAASTAAGDALPMTVTRTSTPNVSPLTVHFSVDDPLTMTVPSSVTIPSGQMSANFSVAGRAPGEATVHATAIGVEDNTNSYSRITVDNPALVY